MELEQFLPYRLSRLTEAVSEEIRQVYRDTHGLNRPEWRVLAALSEIGPATATQVGQHSSQHKTKVSRAVFALEQRRWLRRSPNASDRRTEYLCLTSAGTKAYQDLAAPLLAAEERMLARLQRKDRQNLLRAISQLEKALGVK